MMASLADTQRLLIQKKEEALRSLGLSDVHEQLVRVSTDAAASLRRGAAKRKAEMVAEAAAAPRRRSPR